MYICGQGDGLEGFLATSVEGISSRQSKDHRFHRSSSHVVDSSKNATIIYCLFKWKKAWKNICVHSCPKTVLKFSGLGISFQAQTICPEVVERHLIFAYTAAAPQNKSFRAMGLVCACPETLSSRKWGSKGRGVLWVWTWKEIPRPLVPKYIGEPEFQSKLTNVANQALMSAKNRY